MQHIHTTINRIKQKIQKLQKTISTTIEVQSEQWGQFRNSLEEGDWEDEYLRKIENETFTNSHHIWWELEDVRLRCVEILSTLETMERKNEQ